MYPSSHPWAERYTGGYYAFFYRSIFHFLFLLFRENLKEKIVYRITLFYTCCAILSALLVEKTVFSIVYYCLLFHKLVAHKCVGLFLGCLLCSMDLCLCSCASQCHAVLVTVTLLYSLKYETFTSSFVLFSQHCFGV